MNRDLSFEGILNSLMSQETLFKDILRNIDNRTKEAWKKQKWFVSRFNRNYIANNMSLEEYAVGKGKKDSFCNMLENGLVDLGDMGAASSVKFGIYFSSKTGLPVIGKNYWSKDCKTIDDSFNKIKKAILKLLDDGENKRIDEIERNELSPSLKGKILSTYYPDVYLPVFSDDHIKKYLSYFGVFYDPRTINSLEKRRELLNDFRKNHWFFKEKNPTFFMRFIYLSVFKQIVLTQNDDEQIDYKGIELVDWDYVGSMEKSKASESGQAKPKDYIKAAQNQMDVGKKGEMVIVEYEKLRLGKLGRFDLANSVKKVSGEDGDDSLGYDIKSFDIKDGQVVELHIEVKTTKSSKEELSFYITDNEYSKFVKDESHCIYYLFSINNKPKLHIVDRNSFDKGFLKPILYKVDVEVKRK